MSNGKLIADCKHGPPDHHYVKGNSMAVNVSVHVREHTQVTVHSRDATKWMTIRTGCDSVDVFLDHGIADKIRAALDAEGE